MDLCVMSWKKAEKNKYIYIYIMNNTPNAADDIKAMGDSVDLINKMLQSQFPVHVHQLAASAQLTLTLLYS